VGLGCGGLQGREQIFFGGNAVDLHNELDWTDTDDIAGVEIDLLDALTVDVGAVGTAEVFDADSVVGSDETAVFAGDVTDGNAEVAIFASTDDGHIAYDRKASTLTVAAKHDQNYLHKVPSDLDFHFNPAETTRCA
jgi:hypothetical protein